MQIANIITPLEQEKLAQLYIAYETALRETETSSRALQSYLLCMYAPDTCRVHKDIDVATLIEQVRSSAAKLIAFETTWLVNARLAAENNNLV